MHVGASAHRTDLPVTDVSRRRDVVEHITHGHGIVVRLCERLDSASIAREQSGVARWPPMVLRAMVSVARRSAPAEA